MLPGNERLSDSFRTVVRRAAICSHPGPGEVATDGSGLGAAAHSKRNYAKALDDLFAFCAGRPLSSALLMEYTSIKHLSPSTTNVRMSAIRKLVSEARRNGMIGLEEANLTDIPNVRQKATRLGNWLTREQAKAPERTWWKGYALRRCLASVPDFVKFRRV
jgi:hypothetical protein